MKPAIRVALLCLPLVTAGASAQPNFGAANVQCVQYLKAARSSDILYHQASNWLLGYVSGMNGAISAMNGAVAPINMTNDQVLRSAVDFCERNPGATLANAAGEWYATLPKQAVAPKPAEPAGGSWTIDLNATPKIKPLLDRR